MKLDTIVSKEYNGIDTVDSPTLDATLSATRMLHLMNAATRYVQMRLGPWGDRTRSGHNSKRWVLGKMD
jgi:hypothetical protein